jgi:CubicO group peptidase (beta-lactamase class C family)
MKGRMMADVQARVQAVIDDLVARDVERGMQVAVYYDGKLVVDAWSGIADPATGRRVDGDTLFVVWSVTKGVTATAIHILAERDLLDYDAPIARYWPEFGARGKHAITVRHALTHTAGIPAMPEGVEADDICDWDGMCRKIADLEPVWEPGSAHGYHAVTYGWILGEVAQRVDGRPLPRIVREEICAPLGIEDIYFGIPDAVEPRVAPLESSPPARETLAPDTLLMRSIWPYGNRTEIVANRPSLLRAVLPASGGVMSARAIARHYAALVGDGVDGVHLLGPERLRIASSLQLEAPDVISGNVGRRALGYHLGDPGSAMGARTGAFGHAGAGGALGFADPRQRLGFGLAKNRMVDSAPGQSAATLVAREVRAALGLPDAG